MEKIIHRAETRGVSKYDWLHSKHNFSFVGYIERSRVNFGALRVLNDDIVQPGAGFGRHPHDNMEIISIPLKGTLAHKDSMNHEEKIGINEVQVMSAGTGLFHSEYNASDTEEVNFLQLWIFPDKRNIKPVYDQKYFNPTEARNKWQLLVKSQKKSSEDILTMQQDASISRTLLDKGKTLNFEMDRTKHGSFLFVVYGEIEIDGITLYSRDALGISGTNNFLIQAKKESEVLNIMVPINKTEIN